MAHGITDDVHFDFAGSLQLARRLWEFADELSAASNDRLASAEQALAQWLGAYGEEFAGRVNDETATLTTLVPALRQNAQAWADAWRDATNEQARREYARRVDQMKADRGLLTRIGDAFTGFDYPPEPVPVTSPQPPGFVPVCVG